MQLLVLLFLVYTQQKRGPMAEIPETPLYGKQKADGKCQVHPP